MYCSGTEALAELYQNEAGPLLCPLRDQGEERPQPQESQRPGQSLLPAVLRILIRIRIHMFFGPPGSGSGFISQRYGSGSGSFYH
jgi:hypothetical protein